MVPASACCDTLRGLPALGRRIHSSIPSCLRIDGGASSSLAPFPASLDAQSLAGAEIRYLREAATGNMIHATVPLGQVNRATVHATVTEFCPELSGSGEIWRREGTTEDVTRLETGVSIDIPTGTAFHLQMHRSRPIAVSVHPDAAMARRRRGHRRRRSLETHGEVIPAGRYAAFASLPDAM